MFVTTLGARRYARFTYTQKQVHECPRVYDPCADYGLDFQCLFTKATWLYTHGISTTSPDNWSLKDKYSNQVHVQ